MLCFLFILFMFSETEATVMRISFYNIWTNDCLGKFRITGHWYEWMSYPNILIWEFQIFTTYIFRKKLKVILRINLPFKLERSYHANKIKARKILSALAFVEVSKMSVPSNSIVTNLIEGISLFEVFHSGQSYQGFLRNLYNFVLEVLSVKKSIQPSIAPCF